MNRFVIGLCLSAFVSSAVAQVYHLDVTRADLGVIGAGLDKLPRETTDANGLYGRIQGAINAQDAAAAKAVQDATEQAVAKKRDEIATAFLADIKAAILKKLADEKGAAPAAVAAPPPPQTEGSAKAPPQPAGEQKR